MPRPHHSDPRIYVGCSNCGATARLLSRSPLVAELKGEKRTFRCKTCGEDTKIIVRADGKLIRR
jgi:DNA-directed RNA polymerase subunit RPC12/RpoP